MLGLPQRHPRQNTKRQSLFGGGDNVFLPLANHDRTSIEVGALGELQMAGQTTADAHCSSTTSIGDTSPSGLKRN
jgi:hypothetical protein